MTDSRDNRRYAKRQLVLSAKKNAGQESDGDVCIRVILPTSGNSAACRKPVGTKAGVDRRWWTGDAMWPRRTKRNWTKTTHRTYAHAYILALCWRIHTHKHCWVVMG